MDAHPRETSAMSFFFKHREPLGIKDRTCRQPTVAVDVKNPSIHPSILSPSSLTPKTSFLTVHKIRRDEVKKKRKKKKKEEKLDE
jgi:hypothetical protein